MLWVESHFCCETLSSLKYYDYARVRRSIIANLLIIIQWALLMHHGLIGESCIRFAAYMIGTQVLTSFIFLLFQWTPVMATDSDIFPYA